MTFPLEYHKSVRQSIPASVACFGMFLLPLFLVSASPAQFNNAGSSASAHSVSVAPPTGSVTPYTGAVAPHTGAVAPPTGAFGHNGFAPSNAGVAHSPHPPHTPGVPHDTNHHRHSADGTAYYPYPYYYGVPVPYAADNDAGTPDDQNEADDAEYQGGPTIFDRRGLGAESYIPPVSDRQAEAQAQNSMPAPTANDLVQPSTFLVFKDGHQLEVANYAIVSQTLYDLTSGHHRKIALADLDLPATEKQNDDRGVAFQLPPTAQAN
ncbi:MAG: hypothetical protein WAN65_28815 [Candidatus Sulfotelmatobacter sp.]